jgi:hypothetical protein
MTNNSVPFLIQLFRGQPDCFESRGHQVAEYGGPKQAYSEAGIVQRRVPVIDFTPPSVRDIDEASAFINEARSHTKPREAARSRAPRVRDVRPGRRRGDRARRGAAPGCGERGHPPFPRTNRTSLVPPPY